MVELHHVDNELQWFDLEPCETPDFVSPYLILDEKIAIVETGPASGHQRLLEALETAGIEPTQVDWILPTHIHLDHAGGAGHLARVCPNARVLLHPKGLPHLVKPTILWKGSVKVLGEVARAYGPPQPFAPEQAVEATDGQRIELGQTNLEVHFTPGHASHHLSYFEPDRGWLFSGDAAGLYYEELEAAIPVTPTPYRHDQQLESLAKMSGLDPRLLCYTHFGPREPADQRLEQVTDEYRAWMTIVRDGMTTGASQMGTYERLLMERPVTKAIQKLNDSRFPQKETILHSLEGMLAYIKWEQRRK